MKITEEDKRTRRCLGNVDRCAKTNLRLERGAG